MQIKSSWFLWKLNKLNKNVVYCVTILFIYLLIIKPFNFSTPLPPLLTRSYEGGPKCFFSEGLNELATFGLANFPREVAANSDSSEANGFFVSTL